MIIPSSSPFSAYFSRSSSATLLSSVMGTRRRFLDFFRSQKEFLPMLSRHFRNSSCFVKTPQYCLQRPLFHSCFFPPFFSLRFTDDFLSSRLCGQSPSGHFWYVYGTKKGMVPYRLPFLTACGSPTNQLPVSGISVGKQKSAKKLPCRIGKILCSS